jgi:hypothetical protein
MKIFVEILIATISLTIAIFAVKLIYEARFVILISLIVFFAHAWIRESRIPV